MIILRHVLREGEERPLSATCDIVGRPHNTAFPVLQSNTSPVDTAARGRNGGAGEHNAWMLRYLGKRSVWN